MNSVFVREPEAGNYGKGGPGAGTVRARLPAKPMNSVFVREPEAENYEKGGPGAGTVRARMPAKPMNSVFVREPEAAGRPGTLRALLRNMYKKRLAFLYTIMYYHTNVVKTPLKTPRKNGFAAIPIRELLRIHIITVRKRPCGCVRSVFVFRGGESRRAHNRIPEGLQHRTQPRAGNRGAA